MGHFTRDDWDEQFDHFPDPVPDDRLHCDHCREPFNEGDDFVHIEELEYWSCPKCHDLHFKQE